MENYKKITLDTIEKAFIAYMGYKYGDFGNVVKNTDELDNSVLEWIRREHSNTNTNNK